MSELYTDGTRVVFVDSECRFIYEVMVYLRFKGVTSLSQSRIYSSLVEIPNIIETYSPNKYIDICCYLYAAPLDWLLSNNFVVYVSPKEIKKLNKTKNLKNNE